MSGSPLKTQDRFGTEPFSRRRAGAPRRGAPPRLLPAFLVLCAVALVGGGSAAALKVRLWGQVANPPFGQAPAKLKKFLGKPKLKRIRARGAAVTAYRERVSFERHTRSLVTYYFYKEKLYEVEVYYQRTGRLRKARNFLKRRYGKGKRKGRVWTYRRGGKPVRISQRRGRVVLTFWSPALVREKAADAKARRLARAQRRRARRKKRKKKRGRGRKGRRRKKGKSKKKVEVKRPPAPKKVIADRAADPELWDLLGVVKGPVITFQLALQGPKRRPYLVATGFTRQAGKPLAAIVEKDAKGTYRLHYIGVACEGKPANAEALDLRQDGRADAVIYFESYGRRRALLLPSHRSYAGAKFIGGRYAGSNAFRCYRVGTDVERIDFQDADHDRALDLLLSYRIKYVGPAYDVYFFQGADFYFRETRRGKPPVPPAP